MPCLTSIAALGLAVTMILAAGFNARRGENPVILLNLILLALASFVAFGR